MSRWASAPAALELLELHGGPFERHRFRRAWLSAFPEQEDASFGAELPDGTRAAVALLREGNLSESFPLNYGGIVATRPLDAIAIRDFLRAAREWAGTPRLIVRAVPLGAEQATCHVGATVAGWTSVVRLARGGTVEATFDWKGRRAVRKAREAGGRVVVTHEPEAFLTLYRPSSQTHYYRYPDAVIHAVADGGLARFFEVRIEGSPVAAVMSLTEGSHWIAWLAAQDRSGRAIGANYLAVATLLEEAAAAGISNVNLGISTGMPGVALFKRRFGAIELPVLEYRSTLPWEAACSWLQLRTRRCGRALRRVARRRLRRAV